MKKVKDLDHKLWLCEHLDSLNNNTQELISGLLDGSIEIKDVSQFFLDYAKASEESEVE
jgi:hypothetical protein